MGGHNKVYILIHGCYNTCILNSLLAGVLYEPMSNIAFIELCLVIAATLYVVFGKKRFFVGLAVVVIVVLVAFAAGMIEKILEEYAWIFWSGFCCVMILALIIGQIAESRKK